MRMRVLFVDYSSEDSGAMPNAVVVTDEYAEENFGGIPDPYLAAAESFQESGFPTREAFVEVPDAAVRALFDVPTIMTTAVTEVRP